MSQHLITQRFHRSTKEEAAEQAARATETIRQDTAYLHAEAQIRAEKELEWNRKQVRERVREFRKRKMLLEVEAELRATSGKPVKVCEHNFPNFFELTVKPENAITRGHG